ncbi:FMN-binding protein [Paenibacillus selenitireducens]|uniref:FMN-binding protein n=1 Tax=Paenibacillus selenitireducens TaxID=1324314 RepID=A0A1T2X3Z1_9BACL|nr:FMN-binding protein [Paenibacillus selenitireducens]OPA74589.1 FMN-binding protein [Paenibacillus selenitireducens]
MSKGVRRKQGIKKWIVILIILGVIAVISLGGILSSAPGRREVQKLTIDAVDFKKLRDGTYVGEYIGTKDHSRDTKVQVSIAAGQISDIKILKGALDKKGKPAELNGGLSIGDLFSNVMKSQSLQVDVISGATLTSKAHLKALENALEQAQTE